MRKFWFAVVAIAVGSSVLVAQKAQMPRIEADKIRDAVKYLSSDELEGRGTGQKGGDVAADYIAAQFKSYGLKPAGDNGTYFQASPDGWREDTAFHDLRICSRHRLARGR